MKVIDTDKLQKELSKLSDEKLEKFMMLLPLSPSTNGAYPNWNAGLWTKGIESRIYVTKIPDSIPFVHNPKFQFGYVPLLLGDKGNNIINFSSFSSLSFDSSF